MQELSEELLDAVTYPRECDAASEAVLTATETRLCTRLDRLLSPKSDVAALGIDHVLDIPAIQSLITVFAELTGVAVGLLDTSGKLLTSAGWQDICTRFHRVHPLTEQRCVESDTHLNRHLKRGEHVAYKCGNNMWDVVSPIYIGDRHVANIFTGQFFYDDEPVDALLFAAQANACGFDRTAYLDALGRVPRFSRRKIAAAMEFLVQFADMISNLGYGNFALAKAMVDQKRAKEALRGSRDELAEMLTWKESILNTTAVGILVVRKHRVISEVNAGLTALVGYDAEELVGKSVAVLHVDEESSREFGERFWAATAEQRVVSVEWPMRRKNGEVFWCELTGSAIDNRDIRRGVVWIATDVTGRKEAELALRAREQEVRSLVEHSPDYIIRYDRQMRRTYVNPAAERLLGQPRSELLGRTVGDGPIVDKAQYQDVLQTVVSTGRDAELEFPFRLAKDQIAWGLTRFAPEFDLENRVVSVLAITRDITEMVRQREQLHQLAFYDPLTGLPNRTLFHAGIRRQAEAGERSGRKFALMVLDVDHFKDVNDTLGHASGDQLLREIARRLLGRGLAQETLARLGGDEFAVMVPDMFAGGGIEAMARDVLGALAKPLQINGRDVYATASLGIAVYPDQARSIDELFAFADAAMYHAKAKGRNNYQFYDATLTQAAQTRLSLGTRLRHALARNELELYYQPKVSMPDGRILGAEALLRWNHPELGLLSPDRFIGIAEETGLIVDIGQWALHQSCAAVARWNRRSAAPLVVAVNLSSRQFIRNDLAGTVREALSSHGCPGDWLELEITESIVLEDNPDIQKTLEALSAMGASIAIDDFGTGHSALSYLNRFKVNVLKIDRSFVDGVEHDQRKGELVKAFIAVARALGMEVVAEGVESPEQVEFLCANHCSVGQGYYFGRPMPAAEFERLLGPVYD